MNKREPFLGSLTDREKALSSLPEFTLKIEQDPWGDYLNEERQRKSIFSKQNVPRSFRCCNPRCQQGGLDLQKIIFHFNSGEYSIHCSGHEGSPKGRRKGQSCDNTFKVSFQKDID